MSYNNLIIKIKKNKYQNYINLSKNFYNSYIESRLIIIDKLEKKKKIKRINRLLRKKVGKIFYSFESLHLIFQKFCMTNKISEKDLNMIYLLYKKFEINLLLRDCYDKNFIKISKKKAILDTYVLLGFLINKLKNINFLQKINSLIKINDHLIVNKFVPKNYEIKSLFIKNLKYEIDSIYKLKNL